MEMHFDLAKPSTAEFGQCVEVFGLVLLERIEECMTWWMPVAIAKLSEQVWIDVNPILNPFSPL